MFDPTLHFTDLFTLGAMIFAAYRRLSNTMLSIEAFMKESREDRVRLHQSIAALEVRRMHRG
jgi:hypothetical protein